MRFINAAPDAYGSPRNTMYNIYYGALIDLRAWQWPTPINFRKTQAPPLTGRFAMLHVRIIPIYILYIYCTASRHPLFNPNDRGNSRHRDPLEGITPCVCSRYAQVYRPTHNKLYIERLRQPIARKRLNSR